MGNPATAPVKAPEPSTLLIPTETICAEPKRGALAWCGRNERPIRRWSLVATNLAQVVALFVVGLWTMHRFKQTEEAGLEPHMHTTIGLDWVRVPGVSSECEAELSVSLENIGKTAVDISEMDVAGWLTDASPQTSRQKEPARLITDEELRQGKSFPGGNFLSGYLIGHFPPGAKATDTLVFRLKKAKTQRVLWDVAFKPKDKMTYVPKAEYWDFVCNYKQ